jgi:MOSC domain-containing protein YiiM
MDAMTWVNSAEGKQLRLRGVNTRIVQAGTIRVGDTVTKV